MRLGLTTLAGIPSSVAAVATDAVKTSYHAIVRRAEVKANETVFLFGLGGLGFNALQIVLHIGARVIVSDIRQERLEDAARWGVPREDLVPAGKSVQDFVRENGLQGKIDTTLDFVGTHQTFHDAQNIGKYCATELFDGADHFVSSKRRKASLRWYHRRGEHSRHEDWHSKKTEHYLYVRRAMERSERSPGFDLEGNNSAAG